MSYSAAYQIPPSIAIARYLQCYKGDARQGNEELTLVGPLANGNKAYVDPVIFVDGGANFRQGTEGLVVGDGDSYDGEMDEKISANKNYSDLAYVLAGIPPQFKKLQLDGFLGGRRDHELLNIGEVYACLKHQARGFSICFDDQIHAFGHGEWQLTLNQTFSLICLEPVQVQLTGDCQYPIDPAAQLSPLSSLGLSNKGHGQVQLKCDGPLLLYYSEPITT